MYKGSVLHNLYLQPEYRHGGFGSAILQHLNPRRIRSKTNMLAGDPTAFYEKNGYVRDQPDPERPHIIDMVKPTAEPIAAALDDSASGQAGPASPFQPWVFSDCWAVAGGLSSFVAAASLGPVTPAAPAVAEPRETPQEELTRLRKREDNRQRAIEYRRRKRAELARIKSGTPATN